MIYEAQCRACGETFNPNDQDDLVHISREDGSECGGPGVLLGVWLHPGDREPEPLEWFAVQYRPDGGAWLDYADANEVPTYQAACEYADVVADVADGPIRIVMRTEQVAVMYRGRKR